MKTSTLHVILLLFFLSACSVNRRTGQASGSRNSVQVAIDLVNVEQDRVRVKVTPPPLKAASVTYYFPKIIPGTYAIADYGRYVEEIKAFDKKGKEMTIARPDSNTVVIENASRLGYLSYLVNDTYDTEGAGDTFTEKGRTIFSPAGTNIEAGKQFMLNMAGFVGYFKDQLELPYRITVLHPSNLYGTTALNDLNKAGETDEFQLTRYPEVVDNPIMYASPDTTEFKVNDMEVLLGVYSRQGKTSARALRPDLERMVRAQKKFLGPINTTQKYAVLNYISSGAPDDAKGIGALEHNTSTSAVFLDPMKAKDLIHVISHEFFHTITPLNVHSKEIHYFDFNNPKMSQHLWFYEGITEYFANFFQANQGLITENKFYDLMAKKIENSRTYDDALSFTQMSQNILEPKMKAQYPNVYEKGALIAMCLDIIIREQNQGQKGLLWLMGELSKKYGPKKPFDDAELIPVITQMAGNQVGEFLRNHVEKGEKIDYDQYFSKVGLKKEIVPFPEPIVFISKGKYYIKGDSTKVHVLASVPDNANNFYNNLGIKDNDILLEFNGGKVDPTNLNTLAYLAYDLDENSPITVKVNRKGQVLDLKGTVKLNYEDKVGYRFRDESKRVLNQAWLKN